MSAAEIAQALRHDLKYAGFTLQNIERDAPLEAWAAKAIHKDLFATRRGKSCVELVQEAAAKLAGVLEPELAALQQATQQLESWRGELKEGVLLGGLQTQVKEVLARADALVAAARQREG
jgi:hypothetical protein